MPRTGPTPLRAARQALLRDAGVYLVTEESLSGGRSSVAVARAALDAGVRVVQLREKEGSARRALEIGLALRAITAEHGALLIVNDRVDIAIAIGADGVHVGQEDLPLEVARSLAGPDALVGLSITAADQLRRPDAADADCLGVGAVFPTGSKADATDTGLDLLAAARRSTAAPIVAIGGITVANAGEAVRAGADVLAVISAITLAADPGAAARALLDAVAEARAGAVSLPADGSRDR
ncbi:MAG TPA: thiamine phosphate synthase [Candidatus Limnocylindrales bacterium]